VDETEVAQHLGQDVAFDEARVVLGRPLAPDLETIVPDVEVAVPLRLLNRHGLIAGATGTGKTKTLQVIAEQLSAAGVPVVLGDLKGDLASIGLPAEASEPIAARMDGLALPWEPGAAPVELLSLSGAVGSVVRAPVSSFGPLLLSRVLEATDVQASVLQVVFGYADDAGLALLDLKDLAAVLRFLASDEGKEVQKQIGGLSTQSINVLLRKVTELERQGGDELFGEPEFEVADLQRTRDGAGVVSVLDLTDVQTKPRLFSTFTMWVLAELFETLPEVGDLDRPKLVFVFDEAHLLFQDAPKALVDAVETTVRMIRSKGVGVLFVTQAPTDVPDRVLAQLGHRVQHALRAFTPKDQQALKATADTFPTSELYDVRAALTGVGTGEAVVTVLGPKGAPTATLPTRLVAPRSRMDPLDATARASLAATGDLGAKYATRLDRESAYEILGRQTEERAREAEEHAREAEAAGREAELRKQAEKLEREAARSSGTSPRRQPARRSDSAGEAMVKDAARTFGREIGRALSRGLLGNLTRGR
jgi:uncharacterized protein